MAESAWRTRATASKGVSLANTWAWDNILRTPSVSSLIRLLSPACRSARVRARARDGLLVRAPARLSTRRRPRDQAESALVLGPPRDPLREPGSCPTFGGLYRSPHGHPGESCDEREAEEA